MKRDDSMARRAVLLGGLALPLLAACGRSSDGQPGGDGVGGDDRGGLRLVAAEDVERVVPPRDTAIAPTVEGMSAFAYALTKEAGDPAKNFVASPASIAYAFGMVRAGARGTSAAEIDQVLGFPSSGPHAALNLLTRQVVTADRAEPRPSKPKKRKPDEKPAAPVVALANGVFAQQDFDIKAAYLRLLAEQYGAGVQTVDFRGDATEVINGWVRDQTAERITKLFDEIGPDIVLVLANAVYLKADWEVPFEVESTHDAAFTTVDGDTVTTPMMSRQGAMRYAESDDWQAAELAYAGGELAMWVIVPTVGTAAASASSAASSAAAPASLLAPETLRDVRAGLRDGPAKVVMPRWDFATDLDLLPALQALGMRVPFSDQANFSGIADGLAIGQAMHRATITVDEWGTEAAAVTGLGMRVTALPADPPVEIRADRPFAFAVVHRPTQTPLFVGQVTDPSAS